MAGSAMNCTIDSATAQKRRVRRVYDGVHLTRGDVAPHDLSAAPLVFVHNGL
jgi:hypothetical protein